MLEALHNEPGLHVCIVDWDHFKQHRKEWSHFWQAYLKAIISENCIALHVVAMMLAFCFAATPFKKWMAATPFQTQYALPIRALAQIMLGKRNL